MKVVGLFFMEQNKFTFENYKKLFVEKSVHFSKSNEYINHWLAIAKVQYNNHVPIILDTNDFSSQIGIQSSYLFSFSNNNRMHYYVRFKIKKHNGHIRSISSPLPTLKIMQNWITENILQNVPISDFAKAYRKGYSIKDNVKFHRRQRLVVKLDILNFFPNLNSKKVLDLFQSLGYTKPVSILLTNIVSLNHGLPQGAPSSPMLSNILMLEFDQNISHYCIKHKIRYTRYADDMTFSGENFQIKELISYTENELSMLGLLLNKKKIHVLNRSRRQEVTGIVVNTSKVSVPRTYRKNLRLEIFHFLSSHQNEHLKRKFGHEPNKLEIINYVLELLGRTNYVLQIDPNNTSFINYEKALRSWLSNYKK